MSTALEGKIRTVLGKGPSRQLRREGMLPAVIYGKKENVSFSINPKQLAKIFESKGINALIDLSIEGDSIQQRKAILKESQKHPLKPGWVHVDFYEIDSKEKITVHVPIRLTGVCPGVKQGGTINHILQTMDIECLPDDIPEVIEVPMDKVQLNDVVHVEDLQIGENMTVLHDPKDPVAAVHEEKKKEAKTEEEGAEETATGGAAPATGEDAAKTES